MEAPRIIIEGRSAAIIEGVCRVVEFSPEKAVFIFGRQKTEITGTGLKIAAMEDTGIRVKGVIGEVRLG